MGQQNVQAEEVHQRKRYDEHHHESYGSESIQEMFAMKILHVTIAVEYGPLSNLGVTENLEGNTGDVCVTKYKDGTYAARKGALTRLLKHQFGKVLTTLASKLCNDIS